AEVGLRVLRVRGHRDLKLFGPRLSRIDGRVIDLAFRNPACRPTLGRVEADIDKLNGSLAAIIETRRNRKRLAGYGAAHRLLHAWKIRRSGRRTGLDDSNLE